MNMELTKRDFGVSILKKFGFLRIQFPLSSLQKKKFRPHPGLGQNRI